MLEDLTSYIGEGIHTSLRKFCESNESQIAWMNISAIPDDEWSNVCRIVAQEILKRFDVQIHAVELPDEAITEHSLGLEAFTDEEIHNEACRRRYVPIDDPNS